jgi:hypothetical protein
MPTLQELKNLPGTSISQGGAAPGGISTGTGNLYTPPISLKTQTSTTPWLGQGSVNVADIDISKPPTFPIVQTSADANKIQSQTGKFLASQTAGMTAQQQAQYDKTTKLLAQQKIDEQTKADADLANRKQTNEDIKTKVLAGKETTPTPKVESDLEKRQREKDEADDDMLKKFQDSTDQMLSGTFPLNPLQQAQLDSLKSNFQSLIAAQKEANRQYEGAIVQAGLTGGRSRYAPEIEAGNVYNSVQVGIAKVSELNSKMAGAIASMQAGFQENNYKLIRASYDAFTKAQEVKQKNLDKIHDDIAEALKATNEANAKKAAEFTKEKADFMKTLAQNDAPQEVIEAANAATDLGSLYTSGGAYASTGSGIVGEYNTYKRQMLSQGMDYDSFETYQNRDANRKIAIARATMGDSGMTKDQIAVVDKANTFLSSQQISKDLNVIQNNYMDMIQNIGKGSGAADMALIFNLMKVLDPNSVVRETEYQTGLDKSGNLFAGKLAKLNSYINPKGGFASESSKQNILSVINTAYENRLKTYRNIRNQEVAKAEKLGIINADDYIIDYDMSNQMYDEATFTEGDFGLYLQMNPEKEAIAKQVMIDNPTLSDYEVWQLVESM